LFESFLEGSPDGRGNRPKKKGFFSKLFD